MTTHRPPTTYFPAQRSRPGASVPIPGKATDAQIRQWVETMRLDLLAFARANDRQFHGNADAHGRCDDGEILSLADMAAVVSDMAASPAGIYCPLCDYCPAEQGGPECPACGNG